MKEKDATRASNRDPTGSQQLGRASQRRRHFNYSPKALVVLTWLSRGNRDVQRPRGRKELGVLKKQRRGWSGHWEGAGVREGRDQVGGATTRGPVSSSVGLGVLF